jgi:CheY-like chemotaxis protein/HD-like signal output (HDOD) protein
MSHVLLADPNPTSQSAMKGVLERGRHRFAAVDGVTAAWDFIRENLHVDLVFTDLQLKQGSGVELIQKLAGDSQLRHLPVVVYTAPADKAVVKRCFELGAQNVLVKPYEDEALFAEVDKAQTDPWRARLLEEEKGFCQLMELSPADWHRQLAELVQEIARQRGALSAWAGREPSALPSMMDALRERAAELGAWGVVAAIDAMQQTAQAGPWPRMVRQIASLELAMDVVSLQIDPERVSCGFLAEDQKQEVAETAEFKRWMRAPESKKCPVEPWADTLLRVDRLEGCPVIDTAAAAFQMTANGGPSSIHRLMDLVARDPGLSVQILGAANLARHADQDDLKAIEDARFAVSQLGDERLQHHSHRLLTVPERIFQITPSLDWPRFWTFQRGVARVAQVICNYLELYSMEGSARTAGELHDIGKLVLAHLYPDGFRAIVTHAHQTHTALAEAENLLLGGTTGQLGARLAIRLGLPAPMVAVMRWLDRPEEAGEHRHLVAVVALAREYCLRYEVGAAGEPELDRSGLIQLTPAWLGLEDWIFPSFKIGEFDAVIRQTCRKLNVELAGRDARSVAVA